MCCKVIERDTSNRNDGLVRFETQRLQSPWVDAVAVIRLCRFVSVRVSVRLIRERTGVVIVGIIGLNAGVSLFMAVLVHVPGVVVGWV